MMTHSPLYQKNVVFYGDSLCYARGERGNSNEEAVVRRAGYPGRIATKYEMGLSALGYSGQTISTSQYGLFKHIEKRIETLSAEEREAVDYVILEGGVNDIIHKVPLGELTENDDRLDTATFAGAVQRYLLMTRNAYPRAKVGFIITYRTPLAEHWYNGEPIPELRDLSNAERYYDLIIEACSRYGVAVLDLFHNEEFCNKQFKVTVTTRTDENANMLSDALHISSHGYDVIAPVIAAWMETL
jgi:lysophospholipase L1-like esterase